MPARIHLPDPSKIRIELQRTNVRGKLMGESHPLGRRYRDEQVQRARELRAQGFTYRAIAQDIGCPIWTARNWAIGTRRRPHDRIIVRRRTT